MDWVEAGGKLAAAKVQHDAPGAFIGMNLLFGTVPIP